MRHARDQLIEANDAGQAAGLLAASPHASAWQQSAQTLNLESPPSRRRFSVGFPRAATPVVSELALTDNHLYVLDETNKLRIAPLPTKPPIQHR